jgi:hypothetical protein
MHHRRASNAPVVTKLSDFFGAVQLTGRPAGYPLGRGSFRYAATPQRAASSRGSQSPVLQSLLERGIRAARRRATLRTAAAGASPRSCWRPQRSGAGRRPRADAMSGWNSVSSRQWDRRADACRAAGSLARNNSPWAKTFYRRAFLRCPCVRRGRTARFCVECPAGEVFVAAGGTARFARRAAQLVRSTALAARST